MQSRHSGPADYPVARSARKQTHFLQENRVHDFAVDIGKAEFAPLVAVCQPFVVKPQKMQDSGIEIVDVNR